MKSIMTEPMKRIAAFISSLFDSNDQLAEFEFERELNATARTAHMRTWEYRSDRF